MSWGLGWGGAEGSTWGDIGERQLTTKGYCPAMREPP